MSDSTLEAVLAQRQVTSQERMHQDDIEEPGIKLVVFQLGGQRFALPGVQVREILAEPPVYFVPGAPPALEGVMSVRGAIESVIRVHVLLQLPLPESARRAGVVLLARGERLRSGLRVDAVEDVVDVPMTALRDVPDTLPLHLRPFIRHLVSLDEQLAASVIDLDRLFAAYLER